VTASYVKWSYTMTSLITVKLIGEICIFHCHTHA
jgi:hypothetical protein